MKQIILLALSFVLFGCDKTENQCPQIWDFHRSQLSATALIDSGTLKLQVWNPITPNAIELKQEFLKGNFDVSIDLLGLEGDTLSHPQFRLEVYDNAESVSSLCGIAVQRNIFYCYANGAEPENRDDRLIHSAIGTLQISRENGVITCSGNLGGVELSYSDTLGLQDMGVRLVLGSTIPTDGLVSVRVDDFRASHEWPDANIQGSPINWDEFDCESW
ncbi:MAG: hypothetical protein H6601_11220 [Flavobacteriales bacterium]|nr:hypothetical protein [Flavobacteriales bacterium]